MPAMALISSFDMQRERQCILNSSRQKQRYDEGMKLGEGHANAAGRPLKDMEMFPEIAALFFAGIDTTGHTGTWLLCGSHPPF